MPPINGVSAAWCNQQLHRVLGGVTSFLFPDNSTVQLSTANKHFFAAQPSPLRGPFWSFKSLNERSSMLLITCWPCSALITDDFHFSCKRFIREIPALKRVMLWAYQVVWQETRACILLQTCHPRSLPPTCTILMLQGAPTISISMRDLLDILLLVTNKMLHLNKGFSRRFSKALTLKSHVEMGLAWSVCC